MLALGIIKNHYYGKENRNNERRNGKNPLL